MGLEGMGKSRVEDNVRTTYQLTRWADAQSDDAFLAITLEEERSLNVAIHGYERPHWKIPMLCGRSYIVVDDPPHTPMMPEPVFDESVYEWF